jgi:hypothetical protein
MVKQKVFTQFARPTGRSFDVLGKSQKSKTLEAAGCKKYLLVALLDFQKFGKISKTMESYSCSIFDRAGKSS